MPLLPVPITALYAGLLALLIVILALLVVKLRLSLRIGIGDGGNRDLQRAMRAHGNAVEYVPLFLVLLALFELNHADPAWLHAFGAVFFVSRLMHAWGLLTSAGVSFGRTLGVCGTLLALIALAVADIAKVMGGIFLG